MTCKLKNRAQLIEDYLAGNLSEEAREQFDEHCFSCDACFNELRLREQLIGLIKSEGPILFADYLAQQKAEKIGILQSLKIKLDQFVEFGKGRWIYATALVGALVILALFVYNRLAIRQKPALAEKYPIDSTAMVQGPIDTLPVIPPKIVVRESIQTPPAAPSPQPQPELAMSQADAANFTPLPYYEELIGEVTRSHSIDVLSPKIGEKMIDGILFQWAMSTGEVVHLKVLNNRGEEIFNYLPEQNRFIFKEKLEPGLYYWKLETEEELLFVGKFVVEGSR